MNEPLASTLPLNEPVPSNWPLNEPVKAPAIEDAVISLTIKKSLIPTEPVNCCISVISSPNIFEPDEYITEEEIIFTISWSAIIDLLT